MNSVIETKASKQAHVLPGSKIILCPHWLCYFVLAGSFCLCFVFLHQVYVVFGWRKGNLHMRKCTFLLLLKWYNPLHFVVYIECIDYCKIFSCNTAKQMLLRWNRLLWGSHAICCPLPSDPLGWSEAVVPFTIQHVFNTQLKIFNISNRSFAISHTRLGESFL